MPDISRSDSARSDSSRPRVSFNRDVHVKRIASPRTANAYSLLPDGSGLMPTAVRRERPRTRKEMHKEARDVLRQASNVGCRVSKRTGGRISSTSEPDSGSSNENQTVNPNRFMSLDRKKLKNKKANNLEYLSLEKNKNKLNIDLAQKKSHQLSPIIESPAPDYFHPKKENNIDRMIRRLSSVQSPTGPRAPPGVSGIVKTPGNDVCHNQNLPFSYTDHRVASQQNIGGTDEQEPKSTETTLPPTCDVIYAQVVVGSGSDEQPRKTTVHTRVATTPDIGPHVVPANMTPRPPQPKYYNTEPNLQDLSLRRQILLSRTESQAKERLNTIQKLKEPARNGLIRSTQNQNNSPYDADKFGNHVRKLPKDSELFSTTNNRAKRDEEVSGGRLMQKLSRFGKSKSFIEAVPQNRRGSSRLDLVKQIFRKKSSDSEEDPVATRYREYRGRAIHSDPDDLSDPDGPMIQRKRMPTPVSSSSRDSTSINNNTLTRIKNSKNKATSPVNWFKSLDRLTKKGKNRQTDENRSEASSKANSLRFFGDTDQESIITDVNELKHKYGLHRTSPSKLYTKTDSESERPESRLTDSTIKGSTGYNNLIKSKSKYDLDRPDYGIKQMNYRLNNISSNNLSDTSTLKNGGSDYDGKDYDINGMKYGPNISRSLVSVSRNQSPPLIHISEAEGSPLSHRRVQSYGNLYRPREGYRRRHGYDSSADSATEYDSSVNSTKSTIYLHAATVGDIPGPRNLFKSQARSQSRDELSSLGRTSSPVESSGTKKTLSRSISVLAPWRPKFRQENTISYDTGGKPPLGPMKVQRKSPPREHGKLGEQLRFNTIGRENRRHKDLLR